MQKKPKPIISTFFFALPLLVEAYLLGGEFFSFRFLELPLLTIEAVSLMAILIILLATLMTRGFHSKFIRIPTFLLLLAYSIHVAINFQSLIQLLMEYGSIVSRPNAMALIVAKIVFILLALIAATPQEPIPTPEEYSDFFVDAMEMQKVEWARASERHSKKERQSLEKKLKEQDHSSKEPLEDCDSQ